jgi:hypothetical protein
MTRGILIAGNESSLAAAVISEGARRVEKLATALVLNVFNPELGQPPISEEDEAQIRLHWNPGNPVSARSMLHQAERSLGHIDDAVLICSPPALHKPPAELTSGEIEALVSDNIKGWYFLLKETAAYFQKRGGGSLSFVLPEINTKDDSPDLAGPVAAAAFRALADAAMQSAKNCPYAALGFAAPHGENDAAFAAYIFKTIDQAAKSKGKWHRFGKLKLF